MHVSANGSGEGGANLYLLSVYTRIRVPYIHRCLLQYIISISSLDFITLLDVHPPPPTPIPSPFSHDDDDDYDDDDAIYKTNQY